MARFPTYSTYDNEDVRGMTEAEYDLQQIADIKPASDESVQTMLDADPTSDDWDEYVWTEADSLSEAVGLLINLWAR